MGMRKSTRQELRKLRELVWEAFEGVSCYFCHEPLLTGSNLYKDGHGSGDGTKTAEMLEITIHHRDGNHHNQEKRNRKPCHSRCHRSHHMTMRWVERKRAARSAKTTATKGGQ